MKKLLSLSAFLIFSVQAYGAKKTSASKKSVSQENRAPVDEVKFNVLMKNIRGSNEVLDQLKQMETLRASAENSLSTLLNKKPNDLELNLRLAELRLQRARDFEQFSLELSLGGNEAKAQELGLQSRKLFESGLKHYKSLLPRVNRHPMEGEIYIGMARSLKSLNRPKEALALLKSIQHRSFQKKTNFYLALTRGDLEFALSNAHGAKAAYDEASKYVVAGSQEDMYLTYKKSWVLYNLKDTEMALSLLKKIIEANRDKLALAQEAVQDYSLFVADLSSADLEKQEDGIPGVYRYLSRYSRPEISEKALEKLSETYSQNGRRADAKKTLEFLIENNPDSLRNGERALNVVKYDHDLENTKALTGRYFWLIKNFGPLSSWYKKQLLRPDIQRNTYDAIEESLRNYAVNLHKEADKEKSEVRRTALEETVATLYDAHLENFKEVPRIHYYRAEIYRRLKDYENAAKNYDSFILDLQGYDEAKLEEFDHKIKKEAAFASVEMWAKTIDKNPKLAEFMLKACDRYVELFPKDEKAATVALDAARVEHKSGHPEIALKRIQKLVATYPQSPEAAEGVNAGLDILNKQGDFVNLAGYARDWREKVTEWAPEKKKEELRADLDKVLSTSEAKSCEELAKKKTKILEAALCFRRVADTNQDSDIAPKALVLASDLFKKFGDPFSSLDALETLVQRHPNSDQAIVAFSKLAEGFERTFQFARSAEIYEKLLSRKDVPNRKQVIMRLAGLYTGLGEKEKLEKIIQDPDAGQELKNQVFTKKLRSSHDELLSLERGEGYSNGKFTSDRAQNIYAEFKELESKSKLPPHLVLELRRIEGHFLHSKGNLQKADETWMAGLRKFWKLSPKTPDLWESAARMRLSQGSYWRSIFKSADLAANPQKKVALFQKIEAWNAEVLGMNSPAVALETLSSTAKFYREFAAELKTKDATLKMAADMENKAKIVTQELARRAQNWGLISPLLLSTLKDLRIARGEKEADEVNINFPWPELPRGLEMSAERKSISDWSREEKSLQKKLRSSSDRREQRNLAYVLLMKANSLKGSNLNGWEELLTSKDEVQARIEATIQDNQNDKAEMILAQYEAVYGDDLFSAIAMSRLDVNRREYSSGYKRALSLFQRSEFASKYYAIGWKSLFDELIEGELSSSFKSEAFKVLASSAKATWEKKLLATLCMRGTITCGGEYSGTSLLNLVDSGTNESLVDYADHRSLWRIERDFLELTLMSVTKTATRPEQIETLKKALSKFKSIEDGSLNSKAHRRAIELARNEIKKTETKILAQLEAERRPAEKVE
ncbi:MAG: hypothetical protein R3A80_04810 [Bdellovibrionota bacterium]